jgi:uncharacterized protein (DUF1330 family)
MLEPRVQGRLGAVRGLKTPPTFSSVKELRMAVYMIVDVDVRDTEAYEDYKRGVEHFIAKHGGEYLVRGGDFEILEGTWQPTRLVLFRFPDRDSVRAFLDDPDYQDLKALRHRVADTCAVMVDGL